MSLLFPARQAAQPEERSSVFMPSFPSSWFAPSTKAGQSVVPANACRNAAVMACKRVIVSSVVGMSVEAKRRRDGRWVNAPSLPTIVANPSVRLEQRAWVAQAVSSMVLDGNAYLRVSAFDAAGNPQHAEVLEYSAVSWRGDDAYIGGQVEPLWPVGRLKVVQATPWMRAGRLLADSPVELAKESIGIGLAAEEFMSTHFRDGGFPANVVYSDQELDTTAAEGLKARILAAISGNREPLILGSGLKWEVPQVDSPAWAIDLMRFEIEQAARYFGIPPTMIYGSISGQAVTYSNLTQSETSFLKMSLKSWMEDLESGWSALLPGSQKVRLNADDFLRMDAESRHKDQAVRLASKTATVNEVRLEEDHDPFDGDEWDEPGIPGGAPPVPAIPGVPVDEDPADEQEEQ